MNTYDIIEQLSYQSEYETISSLIDLYDKQSMMMEYCSDEFKSKIIQEDFLHKEEGEHIAKTIFLFPIRMIVKLIEWIIKAINKLLKKDKAEGGGGTTTNTTVNTSTDTTTNTDTQDNDINTQQRTIKICIDMDRISELFDEFVESTSYFTNINDPNDIEINKINDFGNILNQIIESSKTSEKTVYATEALKSVETINTKLNNLYNSKGLRRYSDLWDSIKSGEINVTNDIKQKFYEIEKIADKFYEAVIKGMRDVAQKLKDELNDDDKESSQKDSKQSEQQSEVPPVQPEQPKSTDKDHEKLANGSDKSI